MIRKRCSVSNPSRPSGKWISLSSPISMSPNRVVLICMTLLQEVDKGQGDRFGADGQRRLQRSLILTQLQGRGRDVRILRGPQDLLEVRVDAREPLSGKIEPVREA